MNLSGAIRHPTTRTTVMVLVYGALLHWCYATMISPVFDYRGITYRTPTTLAYLGAAVFASAVAALLPRQLRRPSDFVLWLMFIIVVVPSMLVPHYADVCTRAQAIELSALIGSLFALTIVAIAHAPRINFRVRMPEKLFWSGIAVISVGVYAYVQYHVGLRLKIVSLSDVYDLRSKYKEVIADGSAPLLGYLVRWQAHVINPLIIARGIFGRRPALVVVGAIGQLALFPVTGYKMTLLSIPLLLIFAVALQRGIPRASTLFGVVTGSVFIAILVDKVLGSLYLTTFFVDRLLLTPGVLTAAYVKVFDGQPKAVWGDGVLARFTDYPYASAPPYIVGLEFHGEADTYANANLFADGYANLGYPGMLLEALAFVLVLWALNSFGRHVPFKVTAMLLLMPTLATANSGILTSLLTNGYALVILVLLFAPSDGWTSSEIPFRQQVRNSSPLALARRARYALSKKTP